MNKEIDITGKIIKTERLILRPFKEGDLNDLYEYASVDGVGQMAGWLPHKSINESKMILDKFISGKKTFAITYDNKVIGSLGIEEYNEKEFPELDNYQARELGFVLSKDYWGKGIMPEAVKGVIKFCFEEIDLDYLVCGHFEDNNQSKRVQEKCGFKEVKTTLYTTRYGETKVAMLSILKNERLH